MRFGRFRNGMLSVVPDDAGPLDQGKGTACESTKLLWIGLARGVPQCIDSSAAKLVRILFFLGTIEVVHRG